MSVAIYGSGSSANANFSKSKAKLNRTQVEEQTGFKVGEAGIDIRVANHTQLKGGLIESQAACVGGYSVED